jgi:hypothetical protein
VTEDLIVPQGISDPAVYLEGERERIANSLRSSLAVHKTLKWVPTITTTFMQQTPEGEARIETHFNAPMQILLRDDEINDQVDISIDRMLDRLAEFCKRGSGYNLETLDNIQLATSTYNPICGSSYISLNKYLTDKHALINVICIHHVN